MGSGEANEERVFLADAGEVDSRLPEMLDGRLIKGPDELRCAVAEDASPGAGQRILIDVRNHCRVHRYDLTCRSVVGFQNPTAKVGVHGLGSLRKRQRLTRTLIGHKEEYFVFLNGPAQRAAELIPAERRLGRADTIVLPSCGVELVIAKIVVSVPVPLVGAALGDRVENAAQRAAILRSK